MILAFLIGQRVQKIVKTQRKCQIWKWQFFAFRFSESIKSFAKNAKSNNYEAEQGKKL